MENSFHEALKKMIPTTLTPYLFELNKSISIGKSADVLIDGNMEKYLQTSICLARR